MAEVFGGSARIFWSEVAQATFLRFMADQAGMMVHVNRAVEALADDPALRARSSAVPTAGCASALTECCTRSKGTFCPSYG